MCMHAVSVTIRRRTTLYAPALGIALIIALAGCGNSVAHGVAGVWILDATHLRVGTYACPAGKITVSAEEGSDTVVVRVSYEVDDSSKCAGVAEVTLAEELDGRQIVDAKGTLVPLLGDQRCTGPPSERCDGVPVGTLASSP